MQSKIQELTEKIYSEGVQKARNDAQIIVNEARQKAEEIEHEATQNAQQIIDNAQKQAQILKEHVDAELKMSVSQVISALKQELANLITMQAIQPAVSQSFASIPFMQKLIETTVKSWSENNTSGMLIELPEAVRNEMEQFFKNSLAAEMNSGLEIVFSNSSKSGFRISPTDGSYRISFTETDFINFFKNYLRPKTKELLFDDKK